MVSSPSVQKSIFLLTTSALFRVLLSSLFVESTEVLERLGYSISSSTNQR